MARREDDRLASWPRAAHPIASYLTGPAIEAERPNGIVPLASHTPGSPFSLREQLERAWQSLQDGVRKPLSMPRAPGIVSTPSILILYAYFSGSYGTMPLKWKPDERNPAVRLAGRANVRLGGGDVGARLVTISLSVTGHSSVRTRVPRT
jgi:hypothetical protein